MAAPLKYREQCVLEHTLQQLQREIEEMRWALSDRSLYAEETARLSAIRTVLGKRMAEDEETVS